MSRVFRRSMLRQAAFIFVALGAVLLILVGTVGRTTFIIAAMVLIPSAALTFNFMQRRAYAALQQDSKR